MKIFLHDSDDRKLASSWVKKVKSFLLTITIVISLHAIAINTKVYGRKIRSRYRDKQIVVHQIT